MVATDGKTVKLRRVWNIKLKKIKFSFFFVITLPSSRNKIGFVISTILNLQNFVISARIIKTHEIEPKWARDLILFGK